MTNEESPRIRLLKEELREMEREHEALGEKIKKWRAFLNEEVTGKPLPSPTSSAFRLINAIKDFLRDNGPSTYAAILAHVLQLEKDGTVVIKDGDPEGTTKRSLGTSSSAGTIIKDGETYRLP